MSKRWLRAITMVGVFACFLAAGAGEAWAQSVPAGTCTTDQQFAIPTPGAGGGVITMVINGIKNTLANISRVIFTSIVGSPDFRAALTALLTLAVVVYGVMFLTGMVAMTWIDFMIRVAKFGIVAVFLSPQAWNFMANTVGRFFIDGTDELIAVMAQVAAGNLAVIDPAAPFLILDTIAAHLISARMAVTLIAMPFTGVYGLIFFILLLLSLGTMVGALLQAMWIYVMSLVVRFLLFALSPIFFSFLLFNRTRNLFEGWLNQMVSASLQPILLFAFFSFFAVLIQQSLASILNVPVCWMQPNCEFLKGTPFDLFIWYPKGPPGSELNHCYGWESTPFDLSAILIFLLMTQLAWRFNSLVIGIAKELASASVSLNLQPGNLFSGMGGGKTGTPSPTQSIGTRTAPGGPVANEAAIRNTEEIRKRTGEMAGGRDKNKPPTEN